MGSEQEGLTEIILWSNPDQVMVEEDHFMVELTKRSPLNMESVRFQGVMQQPSAAA